ncbi:MAG TPA: energy-coupling factor transporter transmembrane component T [Patescibacteria group bacterium]|nr:energy-coupling factor transporter transmembrane component T [Patescibacteria group bacterium]
MSASSALQPTDPRADGRRGLPHFVLPAPTGAYRGLAPATKLAIAIAQAIVALGVRGWTGPLVVIAICAASAHASGILRRSVPLVLLIIPLLVSILLVNTFLYPDAPDPIFEVGPLRPTWTGLTAALQATLRVLAFGFSVVVLVLTTEADHLIADLERRGLGRRAAFVLGSTLRAIPRTSERVSEITEAQRARGLDTEGRAWRRVRGIVPLAGPLVLGALTDVEEQTMAMEARAFTAPGRRTVLRAFPDSTAQRLGRRVVLLACLALLAASIAGLLEPLP